MKCKFCGEVFTNDDIQEMREAGKDFWLDDNTFICPDCYDSFSRFSLEEQFNMAAGNTVEHD